MSSPSGSEGAGQKRIFAKGWRAALRPYLDKLDQFVETVLMPKYNRGKRRRSNPAYQQVENAIDRAKRRGDRQALRELRKQRRKHASQDPDDPNYRRLRYVRYADDVRHLTRL